MIPMTFMFKSSSTDNGRVDRGMASRKRRILLRRMSETAETLAHGREAVVSCSPPDQKSFTSTRWRYAS